MAKYKEIFHQTSITQSELLKQLQQLDKRIDKSLLSKIVNHVVLPTVPVFQKICQILKCHPLDLYNPEELDLMSMNKIVKVKKKKKKEFYNLHAEIDRKIALEVLNPVTLKKLGIKSVSEYIRDCIHQLQLRLKRLEEKEKVIAAATDNDSNYNTD